MSDLEEFAGKTVAQTGDAVVNGLFKGDPEPYLSLWSREGPVSVFGAWGPCKTGWPDLEDLRYQGSYVCPECHGG